MRLKQNKTIFFLYLIFLISITLFPIDLHSLNNQTPRIYSFRISNSINKLLENHTSFSIAVNVLGNIVIFIPLGFLLPLLQPFFRKFYKATAAGLIISVAIELIQLSGIPCNRECDILDIILNTTGVMSGYLFYRLRLKACYG